jgi:hypothetical protein
MTPAAATIVLSVYCTEKIRQIYFPWEDVLGWVAHILISGVPSSRLFYRRYSGHSLKSANTTHRLSPKGLKKRGYRKLRFAQNVEIAIRDFARMAL